MKRVKNHYFAKLVISFIMIVILVIGAVGGTLLYQVNQLMTREVYKENQYRLQQIRDLLEMSVLPKYRDIFLDKVLTTINPNNEGSLRYFLDNPREGNMYGVYRLNNELQTQLLANGALQNITAYFIEDHFVVDGQMFYETAEHSPEFDFLKNLGNVTPNHWFARTAVDKYGNQTKVLTYVYTLPYMAKNSYIKGYLYIDLKMDYITKLLENLLRSPEEKLVVFDGEGKPIIQLGEAGQQVTSWLSGALSSQQEAFTLQNNNSSERAITLLPSKDSEESWSYGLARPMNTSLLISQVIRKDIVNVCILVLVLGLFTAFIISYRFGLPMRKLLLRIREFYEVKQTDSSGNAFQIIHQALLTQNHNISLLKSRLRSKQITDLIQGNVREMAEPMAQMLQCSYRVAVFKTHEEMTPAFVERFSRMSHSHPCEVVMISAGEAVALYIFPMESIDEISLIREEIDQFKRLHPHIMDIGIGIGLSADSPEQINESYQQAVRALSYGFIFGSVAVISYEQISDRKKMAAEVPFDELKLAVSSGNAERAADMLGGFERSMKDQQYSMEAIDLALVQIVTALLQAMMSLNLQYIFPGTELLGTFRKSTLSETVDFLKEVSVRIAEEVAESSNHTHADKINTIKLYIDNNLSEDLYLDLLADMVHLSPSYISFVFKEALHVTFSDYVTQRRLETAAELLIEEDDYITEISRKVGYRNVQYFCARFKNKYGMTPLQFRKAQRAKPAKA